MSEPTTPFEDALPADNPDWTPLAQEDVYLGELAAWSPLIAHDLDVARSFGDRPINLLRVGNPAATLGESRRAIYISGCIHGNEPAGREALFTWLREVVAQDADFLRTHHIIAVPTINPDGRANDTRGNDDSNRDLNRVWVQLDQPEIFYSCELLRDLRPLMAIDLHEFVGGGEDVAKIRGADIPDADEALRGLAEDVSGQLIDHLNSLGINADWWPSNTNPRHARNAWGLKHALPILVETNRSEGYDRRVRYEAQLECLRFLWGWYKDHWRDAQAATGNARRAKVHEGLTRDRAFAMVEGDEVFPPGRSYTISAADAVTHGARLAAHGINTAAVDDASGDVQARCDQAAQPMLPYVVDADSAYNILSATRNSDLQDDIRPHRLGRLGQ
ncbi:M14 family zinc carboxypeptidase [Phycisphaerales bacterium AB-hyl4]|uniref:M14 family zinc carboxypeptidase n=1 Tax=Natronomicrosphaera hydrolytica TaxID=3242702 RepID=A0ABV4U5T3_9BACT